MVFLPSNTTSLILPMGHRIITDFKTCYLRKSFAKLFLQVEEPLRRHWYHSGILQHIWWNQEPSLDLGWCHEEMCVWHWEENTQELPPYLERFCQGGKVTKCSKAVVDIENFNLGEVEDGIEEFLEMISENLEEQHNWRRGKRKENFRRRKRRQSPRKFSVQVLAEAFTDINKLIKKFENMVSNTKNVSLIERDVYPICWPTISTEFSYNLF